MRSHLTRSVFRRILSNEPLTFQCPRSPHSIRPRNAILIQRRNLFGFSRKSKTTRQPRDPQLVPGLSKMLDLLMMEKLQARLPPTEELVTAWQQFFSHKVKTKEPVNNYQAQHALRTFRHFQKIDQTRSQDEAPTLGPKQLLNALDALHRMPQDKVKTHNELARELFEQLAKLPTSDRRLSQGLERYITILVATGDSEKARDFYLPWLKKLEEEGDGVVDNSWCRIVRGFAKEDNEEQILRTYEMPGTPQSRLGPILIQYYARKDDVAAVKKWYLALKDLIRDKNPDSFFIADVNILSEILRFSIRNREQQWCNSVFRQVVERNPTKAQWDVIFQWAAGSVGKGVEDVERMMEVMIRRGKESGLDLTPDITTINGLVSLAMSLKDPYLAERYINLGRKFGLEPNAETCILQMDYRLSAGDISGAHAAYEALQSEEVLNNSDVPVMNKYIMALCSTSSPNWELITTIADDIDERGGRVEPSTVSALCILYLGRGETNMMIDVLQAHSYHYTMEERESVRDAFLAHTLNPDTPTARAWECYQIFIHIFGETSIEIRTQALQEFFRRRRSDMALHVFGHMRAHERQDRRPVLATYVECFEGIAACRDMPSLEVVYNMLKMDISIEPNTLLYNSLMLAYAECGDHVKAVRFWDDITNSREGPNYRSLELIFRALQRKTFGDIKAREIWDKIKKMDIEVTREVFVAYVGALAGQGKLEDAKTVVEEGEKEFGLPPDLMTIGHMYNAIPGQSRKDLIGEWAQEICPDVWESLEKLGQQEMKEGYRLFKLPGLEIHDEPDDDEDEDAYS